MSPEQYLPIIIPIVVIALVLLRNRSSRKLNPRWMWVMPVIVLPLIGMGLYFTPHAPFGAGAYLSFALALVLGAAAGWWRGKTVRIEKHPDGHLTAQASPLGLILLVGLFAVRSGLRMLMETEASAWHLDAAVITDAFMLFAVGLIVAQRVEMYLRARKVMAGGGDAHVEAVPG
jgi:membrane protein CcdC involved in cytochrome C biogenesis